MDKTFIRLDGKDYEVGSQAHLDKIDDLHKAETASLHSKIETLSGKLDSAEKAVEAAKREKAEAEAKSADADKERQKDLGARVKSRTRFLMRALRLFGQDDDEEEQDEEKKMDALCDLSERDFYVKALAKLEPDFKADGKTDEYLAGKVETALKYAEKSRGVDGVVRVLEGSRGSGERLDSRDGEETHRRGEHPVAKARRENLERMRKQAKPVLAGEGGAR